MPFNYGVVKLILRCPCSLLLPSSRERHGYNPVLRNCRRSQQYTSPYNSFHYPHGQYSRIAAHDSQTRPAPNDCSETSIPRALDSGAGPISADYLAASIFCLSFRASNVAQVSVHTGQSLINTMPARFLMSLILHSLHPRRSLVCVSSFPCVNRHYVCFRIAPWLIPRGSQISTFSRRVDVSNILSEPNFPKS